MKDDLDKLIDELSDADSKLPQHVAAALERRELARELAQRRQDVGWTQADVARRMGTSQGQITRLESGADIRLSTVARYAAALGLRVSWQVSEASE